MSDADEVDPVDRGLLDAAEAALLSERAGLPLVPWQQDLLDKVFVAAAQGRRLVVMMPRQRGRRAVADAVDRLLRKRGAR